MARLAALMDSHKGRASGARSATRLTAAQLLYYQSGGWAARLRRQDDFYQESALLWLEADTLIRRGSHGKHSLDDFCRAFFGGQSGAPRVEPYDLPALVAALNAVYPYDWAGFWQERLERLRPAAPLEGLTGAGWQLAYTPQPSSLHVAHEADDRDLNLRYSLGFTVDDEGATLSDVIPDSAADRAGLAPGSHLIALNGYRWSKDLLHDTLSQGVDAARPLSLLIEKDEMFKTVTVQYVGQRALSEPGAPCADARPAGQDRSAEGELAASRKAAMRHRRLAGGVLAAGVSLAVAAGAQQTADPQPLADIVVTAEKRSESLEKVPLSVVAFGSQALAESGVQDFSELASRIPGVSFISAGPGRSSYSIRGIASVGWQRPDHGLLPGRDADPAVGWRRCDGHHRPGSV